MEVLTSFGVDLKLLIASVINFVILLFLLNKILYQPLLTMLDSRKKMIDESVKNASLIEQKLQETTQKERQILHKATIDANTLIQKAEEQARVRQEELLKKAEEQARAMVKSSQDKLEEQAAKMKQEIQNNLADLVVLTTTTILSDHMPSEINKEYVNRVIKDIAKEKQ